MFLANSDCEKSLPQTEKTGANCRSMHMWHSTYSHSLNYTAIYLSVETNGIKWRMVMEPNGSNKCRVRWKTSCIHQWTRKKYVFRLKYFPEFTALKYVKHLICPPLPGWQVACCGEFKKGGGTGDRTNPYSIWPATDAHSGSCWCSATSTSLPLWIYSSTNVHSATPFGLSWLWFQHVTSAVSWPFHSIHLEGCCSLFFQELTVVHLGHLLFITFALTDLEIQLFSHSLPRFSKKKKFFLWMRMA